MRRPGFGAMLLSCMAIRSSLALPVQTLPAQTTGATTSYEEYFRVGSALDMDGNWLLVGVEGNSILKQTSGYAYIYECQGNSWVERHRFQSDSPTTNDAFGMAVAIASQTILVGAP